MASINLAQFVSKSSPEILKARMKSSQNIRDFSQTSTTLIHFIHLAWDFQGIWIKDPQTQKISIFFLRFFRRGMYPRVHNLVLNIYILWGSAGKFICPNLCLGSRTKSTLLNSNHYNLPIIYGNSQSRKQQQSLNFLHLHNYVVLYVYFPDFSLLSSHFCTSRHSQNQAANN